MLSKKPSDESVEDYLDRLANCLVGLAHLLTPTWMNPPYPETPEHVDSESAIIRYALPSSSTSRAGSGSQSPSATIPTPLSEPMLLGSPFSEHSVDQMAEAPTGTSPGPNLSLLHEIHRIEEQQKTPSTTPRSSHFQISASSSDMLMPLGSPFAEPGELDQMAEVPTGTSPGPNLLLFLEICHVEEQQKTPSTTPRSSHSQIPTSSSDMPMPLGSPFAEPGELD